MSINVTESCVVGPAAHSSKANKQPGWQKGNFALFQMPATGGRVANVCAKAKAHPPPPPAPQAWG